MKNRAIKQLSLRILVMYVITALLFLTSIELHIHARDVAASAHHEVHISSLDSSLTPSGMSDEIKVSPDGVLKSNHNSDSVLAVILLTVLIAVSCYSFCSGRLRDATSRLTILPFYGTPSLRAPPQ